MKTSDHGRALLAEWEGRRNDVYLDSAGLPTIGVGHLLTKDELASGKIYIRGINVKYHDGLNDADCDRLLEQDLLCADGSVNRNLRVYVNQNQFDCLTIFTYNVGQQAFFHSTLLKVLNEKRYEQVPAQLRRWNRSGGKVVAGLVNRRENEIKLWEGR